MPFDAIGFTSEQTTRTPGAPPWSLRRVWYGFRDRMRHVSGRSQPEATLMVLREARALIGEESRWVQGVYERDGRHCAMGALQAVGRGHWRGVRREAATELLHVARLHGHHSVESMNDSLTHSEVLAMFDTAIARVEFGQARGA